MVNLLKMAAAEQGKLNTGMRWENQRHLKTSFVFSLGNLSRREFGVYLYFLLSCSMKSSLQWRIVPDHAHSQGRASCSLPIPRVGPRAHFWGRGEALPIWERQYKDNMDDFKLRICHEKSLETVAYSSLEKKKNEGIS